MTAISLVPGLTEVTMFGGTSSLRLDDCIAATTIIAFGELSLCPHHGMMEGGSGFMKFPYLVAITWSRSYTNSCEKLRKGLVNINP